MSGRQRRLGESELHLAVRDENSTAVKFLLKQGASVNSRDDDNQTPLFWACYSKSTADIVNIPLQHDADINILTKTAQASVIYFAAKNSDCQVIEKLLNYGLKINIKDADGWTPLMWACLSKDNLDNVTALIRHEADIDASTAVYGANVLHIAAKYSDRFVINLFINKHRISVNKRDNDKRTPIFWACQSVNNVDNIITLIENGAIINELNGDNRRSLLHIAAKYSDSQVVKTLIKHGISVNAFDSDGQTPLLYACYAKNNVKVLKTLIRHGTNLKLVSSKEQASALHVAAKYSDGKAIEFLLNQNINVNVLDSDNKTPLIWACTSQDNAENMMMLLQHGTDINITTKTLYATALHFAALYSDSHVVSSLIDAKASVNAVDIDNQTPLIWSCCAKNNTDNIVILLQNGADVTIRTVSCGACAVHYGAKNCDREAFERILYKGITADLRDKDDWTPLMWACKSKNNAENVSTLIQYGADVNATTEINGTSALHIAAPYSDSEVIKTLLKQGVSINVFDKDDETPLVWACREKDNSENVDELL